MHLFGCSSCSIYYPCDTRSGHPKSLTEDACYTSSLRVSAAAMIAWRPVGFDVKFLGFKHMIQQVFKSVLSDKLLFSTVLAAILYIKSISLHTKKTNLHHKIATISSSQEYLQ